MKTTADLESDLATFQDDLQLARATAADKHLKRRDRRAARAEAAFRTDMIRATTTALDEARELELLLVACDLDASLALSLRRYRRRVARDQLAALPSRGLWSRWEADGTLRVGPADRITPEVAAMVRRCKETLQEEMVCGT